MKPKYNLGEIVVADLSVDKVVGYIIEIQTHNDKTFNGWYRIYNLYAGNMNAEFTAKEEWLETYEEFSDRRHSKV